MRSRADLVGHAAPASRAPAARRGSRRRTAVIALGILGLLTAAAIAVRPMVDDAIKEFTLPLRHEDVIRQQARDKNLDPALIAAVIYAESRFVDQKSSAGALGLMQITPQTAHAIEHLSGGTTFVTSDLSDPQINISYGCYYLRYLLDHYNGNEVAALAAYNAGTGNVDKWGGSDLQESDIEFPETRAYVNEVLDKQQDYRDQYAADLGLGG
jgi:soluble lytic murein transglycosylase